VGQWIPACAGMTTEKLANVQQCEQCLKNKK